MDAGAGAGCWVLGAECWRGMDMGMRVTVIRALSEYRASHGTAGETWLWLCRNACHASNHDHDLPFGASDGLLAFQLGTNAGPERRARTYPIALQTGARPAASLLSSRRVTEQAV